MRRSLIVVTSTGIATTLEWWNTMMVDGSSLVLANAGRDDPGLALVVAELGSEGEAQTMFRVVRQRMALGAPSFDARAVDPFVSRNVAHEGSRHAHEGSKEGT